MIVKKLFSEFDEETIRKFVKTNADYYIEKWKSMADNDTIFSWNLSAFLFNIFWLNFRKMYIYSVLFSTILFALLFLLPVSENKNEHLEIIILTLFLGLLLIIGFIGNYLYARYTYKTLTKYKFLLKDKDNLYVLSVMKGDTSLSALFIGLFIDLTVGLFLAMILVSIFKYFLGFLKW
ncbi:MAG: hypothetical protein DSY66_03300 [Persephonella sp.]|nr:MAG: hypothetical protein DSY53_02885 [Persephonella sp.]RUM60914.1 MAG: hypothetical protein DSY66_03300 [Persephonella sp.]